MLHKGVQSKTIKGLRRLTARWNAASEMDSIVAGHRGRRMNKWSHYFEIYDRHFAAFRDQNIVLVEIGVQGGGSLDLWRSYFGPKATIVGIDIDPKCKDYESPNTFVRIGSQGDDAFLEGIAKEFGPLDIVVEDGSHAFAHQIGTFRALFPHIRGGGLYACEDLCSSYWVPEFGGGVRKPGTGIEFFKTLIDEMNAWYSSDTVDNEPDALAKQLFGIHFHPALAIIEKRAMTRPVLVPVGETKS